MTYQSKHALFLLTLLAVGIGLIWNGCRSFRDHSDKSDAELFKTGSAPCQWRARMNDTPVESRMTKYGPVCR